MGHIERDVLEALLKRWQTEEIDERTVHEEAESLWEEQEHWPTYPKDDPRSIAVEVLSQLEILNHQLITRADIPAMLEFLNTPQGSELRGWSVWERYWEKLDLDTRKKALKDNPYYSTEGGDINFRSGKRRPR